MMRVATPAERRPRSFRRLGRHAALAAVMLASMPAGAQFVSIPLGGPHPVKPSPNRSQRGAPADMAGSLAVRGRPEAMSQLDPAQHPAEVLAFLGLSYGARVLVVETDTGYYSSIIGPAVGPGGRVTAVVHPDDLTEPARRAAVSDLIARVPGLSIVADPSAAVRVVPGSLDFVLMDRVYREMPSAFVGELFAALRPGGIVGVVDVAAGPGLIDEGVVSSVFWRAGFVFDSESNVLRTASAQSRPDSDKPAEVERFILRFRKPE